MSARKTLGIIPRLLLALAVAFAPLAALAQAPAIQTAAVLSKKSTAALDLNFQTNSAVYRGANVGRIAAVPGWTFTRPGTNLLLQSQTLDNASWTKNSATVAADAVTAPDGTLTADKLAEAAASAQHYVLQSATITTVFTVSGYFKAAERSIVWIYSGHVNAGKYFDLAAGTVGSTIGTGANITASSITSAGGGWYRCAISFSTGAGAANTQIGVASTDGTLSYLGVAGSGIYVWGAQLEPGSVANAYQFTTSAALTNAPITYGETLAGRLLAFSANDPRVTDKGLLVEAAATNLLLQSVNPATSPWVAGNITVAQSGVGPAGSPSFRLTPANTASAKFYYNSNSSGAAGSVTAQVQAKSDGYRYVLLKTISASGGNRYGAIFDLDTGAFVSAVTAGSPTGTAYSITRLANGYSRISVRITTTTAFSEIGILPLPTSTPTLTAALDLSDATNGVDGILITAPMIEAGAFPTSYIPTTTAAATRAADVASISNFGSTITTPFVMAAGFYGANASIATLLRVGSTVGAPVITDNDGGESVRVGVAGVAYVDTGGITTTPGASYATAFKVKPGGYRSITNGNTVQTSVQSTGLVVSGDLYVGSNGSGAFFANTYIRFIRIFQGDLPDGQLYSQSLR